MKKDNRIVRPEQLNEKSLKGLQEGIEALRQKIYGESFDERMEKDPNAVKINGKWYDKRYIH